MDERPEHGVLNEPAEHWVIQSPTANVQCP
jgi:hypothetical protein